MTEQEIEEFFYKMECHYATIYFDGEYYKWEMVEVGIVINNSKSGREMLGHLFKYELMKGFTVYKNRVTFYYDPANDADSFVEFGFCTRINNLLEIDKMPVKEAVEYWKKKLKDL